MLECDVLIVGAGFSGAVMAERLATQCGRRCIGRLATYRYYNMDQVVGMALTEFEKLRDALGPACVHREGRAAA